MQVGMMWMDGDLSLAMEDRVQRAARYYHEKYGREANVCFAHPKTLGIDFPPEISGVKLSKSGAVLPQHFWLGVEDPVERAA